MNFEGKYQQRLRALENVHPGGYMSYLMRNVAVSPLKQRTRRESGAVSRKVTWRLQLY